MEAERTGLKRGKKGFFQAGASVRRRLWNQLPSLRESQQGFVFPRLQEAQKKTREKSLKVLVSPSPVWALLVFFFYYFGRRECLFQAKGRGWEDVSGAAACKSVINSEQTSPGSSQAPFPCSLLALGHLKKKFGRFWNALG